MKGYFLQISNSEEGINAKKVGEQNCNNYLEKNIKLFFEKNNPRYTHYSTKKSFIFSSSRIENSQELSNKFNLDSINSDAKLINDLFQIIGIKLFNHLRGKFSVTIYDKCSKKIFSGCDHNGFYPTYFSIDHKKTVFSSDPKLIYLNHSLKKEIDEEILTDYLVCGLPRETRTIYKNIFHVPGNFYISKSIHSEEAEFNKYFSFKSKINFTSTKENTKEIFLQTIQSKLETTTSDVASMLSGGLDSSSIVCGIDFLNKENKLNKNLHVYSAIFPSLGEEEKKKADESNYIDAVLSQVNSSSTKLQFHTNGPMKMLDKLTDLSEPALAPNLYITFSILNELQKKNIKFLFDGSGGDSILGHGHARFLELGRKLRIFKLVKEYNEFSKLRNSAKSLFEILKRFVLKPLIPFSFQRRKLLASTNRIDYFNANLFLKNNLKLNSYERFKDVLGFYPYIDLPNSPNVYAYEEVSANSLFGKYGSRLGFHIGNKFNVEIITPFFDKDFMRYCLNIPMKEKMRRGYDRSFFRRSMSEIVPKLILNRTSKGDLSPVFRNEFKRYDNDQILNLILENSCPHLKKIIDRRKLLKLLKVYRNNPRQENANILYKLVYLSVWLKKNF